MTTPPIVRVFAMGLVAVLLLGCSANDAANDVDAGQTTTTASPLSMEPFEGTPAELVPPGADGSPVLPTTGEAQTTNTTTTTPPNSATSTTAEAVPLTNRALPLVLDVADRRGDHDVTTLAPGYADALRLRVYADDLEVEARLEVNGPIPPAPDDDEREGVGIDLLVNATDPAASDAQFFAINIDDQWYAYMQLRTDDPVALPGRFVISGNTFIFRATIETLELPDGPLRVSAFIDYDRFGTVDVRSADQVPDNGTADASR